jgi:integrase/recombinase XerD
MRVQIRDAKGNRDRFVPLPAATLTALRQFWQLHRHPELLFPNRHGGLKAAQACQVAARSWWCANHPAPGSTGDRAKKKITPHSLRHSYATPPD